MSGLEDLPLFSAPMVRRSDRRYAQEAADRVRPTIGKLQRLVVEAFRELGEMTAHECENLPRFGHYRQSTVRKRMSELRAYGVLTYVEDADEATYTLVEERVADPIAPHVERCSECGQVVR